MKVNWLTATLVLAVLAFEASLCEAKTLVFAGRTWTVKSGSEVGPGPNNWSENNAWVDSMGQLHLKISLVAGKWYCAEVYSNDRLGFGKYQWYVVGRVDKFDKNTVLGLFPYLGPDGQNEMDIEMAKWGNAESNVGNFTVYPPKSGLSSNTKTFPVKLSGDFTTHRFDWQSKTVLFQMLHGHRSDNNHELARWNFAPFRYQDYIPQATMKTHMNLWLFKGRAPSDQKPAEVIIRSFQHNR